MESSIIWGRIGHLWSGDSPTTGGWAGEAVGVRRESRMVLSQLQLFSSPLALGLLLAFLRVPEFIRLSLFMLDSAYLHPYLWFLQRFGLCAATSPQDSCYSAQPC